MTTIDQSQDLTYIKRKKLFQYVIAFVSDLEQIVELSAVKGNYDVF